MSINIIPTFQFWHAIHTQKLFTKSVESVVNERKICFEGEKKVLFLEGRESWEIGSTRFIHTIENKKYTLTPVRTLLSSVRKMANKSVR